MKMNPDSLPAKLLQKVVQREKRNNREKPAMPFVGEKKQMWYFLMNQVDREPPSEGPEAGEDRNREPD